MGLRRGASLGLSVAVTLGVVALGHAPVRAEEAATGICGAPIAPEDSDPKRINLVLDDSGSMFYEPGGAITIERWSEAKYALEIFAALMGPNDTLRVYRLSDFDDPGDSERPVLELQGSSGATVNAQEIRSMNLVGQETPFLAVEEAAADLLEAPETVKWLTVISDGKFRLQNGDELEQKQLDERVRGFVTGAKDAGNDISVAYLAIGKDVPVVTSDSDLRIFAEQAPDTSQLRSRMNDLADRIFGRDARDLDSDGLWQPGKDAVEMDQMIVFAQGDGVRIGDQAETSSGPIAASEIVDVRWSDNPNVVRRGQSIPAKPNTRLQGQVALFENVSKGDVAFDIENAESGVPVRVFYKPQVTLGYVLEQPDGTPVPADVEPVAGEYTLTFGLMDSSCSFVTSSLLGDPQITATLLQNGKVLAQGVESGTVIDFPKGDVEIELSGTYLKDVPISNPEPLTQVFARPAFPSEMIAESVSYKVSEMAEFPPPDKQIPLLYTVIEDGVERPPTEEEWALLDPETFTFESASNLEFEVVKNDAPGDLSLLVRAPDGDVYAAQTGDLDVTVRGSYLPGQTENAAEATVPITVEDDLSWWDRLTNWLATTGWKILLALLLLAILLGYIFKRRFSKRVNRRPSISGTPKTVGMTAIEDRGKFQVNGFRRFLPFVANTATLSYVPPGTTGFRTLKLKAGPGRSMIVTNWKEIAEKDNVEINGTPINSETRRAPKFGAGGTISASTPQMTFELSPGN